MTTHIIFWNPDISSYTKERFLDDYNEKESVGNWSFYEHEKVKKGDIFFMIKCGGGKTGIVMRGEVFSDCYKDVDWSPKNRPDIYYADIIPCVCINPWSDATLLSPDELTAEMPDFNWYGGHSGRKLDDTYARKLEHMWFQYLDRSQQMFCDKDAWIGDFYFNETISEAESKKLVISHGSCCEICGYSYAKVFGKEIGAPIDEASKPVAVLDTRLKRLLFNICNNCYELPEKILAQKLIEKWN